MAKVFIDGSAGTTGLRIYERLSGRHDIELIILKDDLRKDINARKEAINKSDIAFLCLPDAAAVDAVSLIENTNTSVIDTSSAHRVNPKWTYGFPELRGMRQKIKASKRIANPGCHASGFVSLIAPLRDMGLLKEDAYLTCYSLTGYSGGGKKMISEYEDKNRSPLLDAPRMYALSGEHKHLKEMKSVCKLENAPVFCPIVAPFYSGMQVTVSLTCENFKGTKKQLCECYADYYKDGLISFKEGTDENGFMSASALSGRDDMQISVCGNDERIILVSRFDNLGKGASGSAIQNMNILLGINEKSGLIF